MTAPGSPWRPVVGSALMVIGVGAVVALAFWLLDLYLGDMPSPWAGFAAGSGLTLVSVLRAWRNERTTR